MSDRTDNIQRLLQTLDKHSDIVCEAFSDPVAGGDRKREAAVTALVNAGALKPYEEGTYYLSAPLHDYFSSALSSFHAMRALTRIHGHILQASGQWDELVELRGVGSAREMRSIESAIERSIIEIGDIVERNIALLNSMVANQYGNVQDLASKFRQNRFYAREVVTCLAELGQIEAFVTKVSEGVSTESVARVRSLVIRRLGASMLPLSSRLKDVQAVIERRIFDAKLLAKRLKQLARYASWIAANPLQQGWDIDVPENANPALCRARAFQIRPQPDFHDPSQANVGALITIAQKMAKRAAKKPKRPVQQEDNTVLSDEIGTLVVAMLPQEVAFEQLCALLDARSAAGQQEPVCLAIWKESMNDAIAGFSETPVEHWLIYAARLLNNKHCQLRFVGGGSADPFEINTRFHDIEVLRLAPPGPPKAPASGGWEAQQEKPAGHEPANALQDA